MAKKPLSNSQAPERKNLNELEILRIIIESNPRLREKVINRIQEFRDDSNDTGKKIPGKK